MNDERKQRAGDMERLGESAGAMMGRAAEAGVDVTSRIVRSAADMLGGWWSSEAPRRAASEWSDDVERRCRTHYESESSSRQTTGPAGESSGSDPRREGSGFDRARPGYRFGHVAGRNPDYRGRDFGEVEPELKRVWERGDERAGSWPEVRGYVDFGYQQQGEADR